MANQQLKRLLRRGPEMEEAEFELLQSRVLSRLTKVAPEPTEAPPVEEAAPVEEVAPEAPLPGIDAGPSTNGTHADPSTIVTPGDPPPEPSAPDSRIRSIKVATYDLPAPAVGVMEEPQPLPDWDLAALPMIVHRPPRKVATVRRSAARTGTARPAERRVTRRAVTKRADADRGADTLAPVDSPALVETPILPTVMAEPTEAVAPTEATAPTDAVATEAIAWTEIVVPTAPALATEAAVAAPKAPSRRVTTRTARPRAVAAPIAPSVVVQARPAAAAVPYCPYCALRLDPPPTTSRRCTRCHERIVVKRVEGRVIYLTEASVAVFEAERLRMTNAGRWTRERSRWLKAAATVGAPVERIVRLAAAPVSADVVAAAEALYTTTVERSFRSAKRDRRWEDASRVRREHAQTLFRLAGSPIPPPEEVVRLHREGAAAQLRGIEEMTRQAELVSAGCCDACRADGGQTFKISLELRAPRLPHAGCPKGLCRCDWYLPVRDQTMVRRQLRRRARADQAIPSRGE